MVYCLSALFLSVQCLCPPCVHIRRPFGFLIPCPLSLFVPSKLVSFSTSFGYLSVPTSCMPLCAGQRLGASYFALADGRWSPPFPPLVNDLVFVDGAVCVNMSIMDPGGTLKGIGGQLSLLPPQSTPVSARCEPAR